MIAVYVWKPYLFYIFLKCKEKKKSICYIFEHKMFIEMLISWRIKLLLKLMEIFFLLYLMCIKNISQVNITAGQEISCVFGFHVMEIVLGTLSCSILIRIKCNSLSVHSVQ